MYACRRFCYTVCRIVKSGVKFYWFEHLRQNHRVPDSPLKNITCFTFVLRKTSFFSVNLRDVRFAAEDLRINVDYRWSYMHSCCTAFVAKRHYLPSFFTVSPLCTNVILPQFSHSEFKRSYRHTSWIRLWTDFVLESILSYGTLSI